MKFTILKKGWSALEKNWNEWPEIYHLCECLCSAVHCAVGSFEI